ncbi:actin-related protein 5-like, partial [Scleropages formosus]
DYRAVPDQIHELRPECVAPRPAPISQFDRNVVVNFDIQELMFDYVFMHLGIGTELSSNTVKRCKSLVLLRYLKPYLALSPCTQGRVEHPVVLTEAPCNPLHCRQMMSELLFECYGVPHVSYGVDALFSFYYNNTRRGLPSPSTGLVVSSGYHCSHIVPVINGRIDAANCKRVNIGGSHAASYLQRLLQLKYPGHAAAVTLSRMEELLHEHSYVAVDYQQGPPSLHCSGDTVRLCHVLQELLEEGLFEQFHKSLVELNMDSAEELQSYICKLSLAVEQGRQRILQSEMSELEQPLDEADNSAEIDPDFGEDTDGEKPATLAQPTFNMAEYHQLYVGTERLRVPEIIFQPSLTGDEQMGIMETLQYVLDRYGPEQQEALVRNVFLTGGNMLYPGMKERAERELLAMRPFQSHFQVEMASRPALDAWRGACEWALRNSPGASGWISRQDYEEKGGEYLSEHCASNVYLPMRIAKPPPKGPEAPAAAGSVPTGTDAAPVPVPAPT